MKKNFFKKLAFVMALALVVANIAPASAAAATTPSMKNATKVLVLNDEDNTKFDFNIKNKVSGSTYKWTSSNKSVATVKSTNGLTTAKAIGTATISCKITFKTGKTKTLKSVVTVKENMKTLTISNASTAAIAVGAEYDFNRSYTTLTGGKSTDITRWEVTDAAGKASISNMGVFTATTAGKYTVVARSFQSKTKYNSYLTSKDAALVTAESAPVTITVAPSMVSIAQSKSTQFAVTFDTDMSKVITKDNLVLKNAAGIKLASIVKSVTFDTTGKIATVVTYIPLTDAVVYTVSYDTMSKDFTASAGAVAKIAITGPVLVSDNVLTAMVPVLYDAKGVEVTAATNASVTYAITNNIGWVNGAGDIILFTIGNAATVVATYHTATYDATGTEIVIKSEPFTVTCVDDATAALSAVTAWTIASAAGSSSTDFTTPSHSVALGDNGKYIAVKTKDAAAADVYTGYTFTTADSSKLIVNATTGALVPVSVGEVSVIVKKGTFQTVITVTVTATSAASSATVNKNNVSLSNAPALLGTVAAEETFTLTVKDQYSSTVTASAIGVTSLERPSTVSAVTAETVYMTKTVNGKVAEFKFVATNATAGTYTYKLTANDKSQVVKVVVGTPATPLTISNPTYRFVATSTLDMVVNNDNKAAKNITVAAFEYDQYGVAVRPVTMAAINIEHADGTDFVPTITGTTASFAAITVGGNVATKKLISTGSLDNVTKTGNYTITGTTVVIGTEAKTIVPAYLVVTDTQAAPSITQSASTLKITNGDNLYTKLADCFAASTNASASSIADSVEIVNVSVTSTMAANMAGNNVTVDGTYDVLVKQITVVETFGSLTYTRDIDLNKVITVTVE